MTLQILDRSVDTVAIIDDAKDVRESYEGPIEDLDLQPLPEPGPLPSIAEYVRLLPDRADAAICDHQLAPGNYARYSGAQLAAELCRNKFPTLLCTSWKGAKGDDIRSFRQYLPVVLLPTDLNPGSISDGLKRCVEEFGGVFRQDRKAWRTLVRIEAMEKTGGQSILFVVVSAWDPKQVIRLYLDDLPSDMRPRAAPDVRLHARVNLGADDPADLYFSDWESE